MRKGWEVCNLEDYIKLIDYRGRTPVKTETGVRLITAKNVKLGFLQLEPQEFINPDNYESWMTRGIPNFGDVIFTTEAPLANVAQIDSNEKLAFAQRIIVMQPHPRKIDQTFLKYLLLSPDVRKDILSNGTGATVQGIKSSLLKKIKISFPSLPEQNRIVAILDEAFEAIDQAKTNTEKNLQNAKELFQSELNSIFTNKGEGWAEKRIDEVSRVVNGFAFKSSDFSPKNLIKSVKITNVGVKEFVEEQDNFLPEGFQHKYIDFQVRHDDIVVALTRTIISSGLKVAKVPLSYDGALINQRVAAIVPNENIIKSNLLYSFMCSDIVSNYVTANVNTLMQPNLSINDLKRLSVPVPPLKYQHSITQKLDALSAVSKQLEENYRKKLESLEELKKSILQKAFSGELTRQTTEIQMEQLDLVAEDQANYHPNR